MAREARQAHLAIGFLDNIEMEPWRSRRPGKHLPQTLVVPLMVVKRDRALTTKMFSAVPVGADDLDHRAHVL